MTQTLLIKLKAHFSNNKWFRRFGLAGFLFFFIKGMVWIAIALIGYFFGPEVFNDIKTFFTTIF